MKDGGFGWLLLGLVAVLTLLCGLPLLLIARTALVADGAVTLAPLVEALQTGSVQRALWNSVSTGLASATLATGLGTVLALVIGLANVRAKGALVFLLLLPMMIPPHVTAIAWIQMLGPGSPVLRPFGLSPGIGGDHPLYSRSGLVLLLALQHMPLVFLLVRAALRTFPREMVEAARGAGAGGARILLRIMLPLLAPTLLTAFVLSFVAALGNFGINALVGIPARVTTLPVLIWRRLAAFGPDVLPQMAVIALVTVGVTLAALGVAAWIGRRADNALVGPPQAALAFGLGRGRMAVEAALWLFVALTLVLPALSLLTTALVATYGLPLAPDTLTLANFAEVLWRQDVTLRAFANSTFAAGLAAALIAAAAIVLGYGLRTRGWPAGAARAANVQADVAFAVPGIVMSVGFILVFIRPLPVLDVSLYGTLALIVLAYLGVFAVVGLKPVATAYRAIDPGLDDAARVAGAGAARRIARIFAPLVAPAAASGAILVFLTAYNEITVSALLWSFGSETIGTTIFNYEDGGYTTLAAAMSVTVVVATVLIMLAMNGLARHAPPGVVPWRD